MTSRFLQLPLFGVPFLWGPRVTQHRAGSAVPMGCDRGSINEVLLDAVLKV